MKKIVLYIAMGIALFNCTGEKGEIGPKGPTGDRGPDGVAGKIGAEGQRGNQGPAGVAGNTGPAGPNGTTLAAKVYYTDWAAIESINYSTDSVTVKPRGAGINVSNLLNATNKFLTYTQDEYATQSFSIREGTSSGNVLATGYMYYSMIDVNKEQIIFKDRIQEKGITIYPMYSDISYMYPSGQGSQMSQLLVYPSLFIGYNKFSLPTPFYIKPDITRRQLKARLIIIPFGMPPANGRVRVSENPTYEELVKAYNIPTNGQSK